MNMREKVNTMIERIKIYINDLKFKYSNLPAERKRSLHFLIAAILVFVAGSLFIIYSTVLNIDGQRERNRKQSYYNELNEINKELEDILDEFGYEEMRSQRKTIEADFKNYNEELEKINSELEDLNLPVSSPVND